jgi:tetratricopeptide (TPR) repeat protein
MHDASQEPGAMIAELARTMLPERRERFLDAACGADSRLRASVEERLNTASEEAPLATTEDPVAQQELASPECPDDAFESLALEAVSAAHGPAQPDAENSGDETDGTMFIGDYCHLKALDPAARVRVFQAVCRVVDEAHWHGVIFGSLTPMLIQIGPDGSPSISRPQATVSLTKTDPESVRYTSPEQILGEPVTTSTDVYALGVVLYELLTDHYPYRTSSPEAGRDELFQAISEQAPERPSRIVARQEAEAIAGDKNLPSASLYPLQRFLDSDLELIVLKAMQKEPERRYRSAGALADDIDRFFEGRPVLAHQPNRLYATGKLIARHRTLAILGGLLAIALVSGLIGSSLGMIRARRARSRADVAYRTARDALDGLFSRVEQSHALSAPDLQPARTALLEDFLHYYERAGTQPDGSYQKLLEAAQARQRVGRIYELMGVADVAAWQYEEALEAFKELEKQAPESRFEEERAALLGKLGDLLRSLPGRRVEARADLEQAYALLEAGRDPNSPLLKRRALARVLRSIAELERDEGNPEPAAAAWRRAFDINRELVSGSSSAVEDQIAFAESTIGLGRALALVPATADQGVDELTRGTELRQAIIRAYPERIDQLSELAKDWSELATLNHSLGRLALALENAKQAVAVYEQLDRRFPERVPYQTGLYLAYDALSRLLGQNNETKVALDRSNQARSVLQQLVSRHPKERTFPLDLSRCHNLIGRLQTRRRAYLNAFQSFQRAVDLLESTGRLNGEDSYQLAVNLAMCISLLGATVDMPPLDDESALSPADQLRRQVYGRRAVAALEQALSGGFTNPEPYRTDPDLDSLRDRPDFQKLLQGMTDTPKEDNVRTK